ncbi:MAG: secretin and TonB N-terminal domain-containing protein [Planctomycetota bacterium]|nr:secretin and TonB N-terminal domain-containing protein [Planctomycetota bacterium]
MFSIQPTIRNKGYSLPAWLVLCFFTLSLWYTSHAISQDSLPTQQTPYPFLPPPSSSAGQTYPNTVEPINQQTIPVVAIAQDFENRVQLQSNRDQVTLVTRDAPLSTVLSLIAQQQGLNIVTGEEVNQRVNVTLNNVRLNDALDAILAVHGYTWVRQNNIITISSMANERKMSPSVQGRMVRVFTLNYVLADDVEKVVKGLMSPLGQTFTNKVTIDEQRNAHEQIVVEDLPPYLVRIADYIAQVDTMPRQVVVEANILQVTLKDNNKHGVNFSQLARVNRANVTFGTMGLASGTAPASMMRVEGSDLTSLIDLLKSTSDTKTLASPKVAVVNGQKARISVGGEIGYLLTTATNTSTLQSVAFLEFGVVLNVTPIITEDGQVLMTVAPSVSTGRINPTSKLPEKELTQVETTALLENGQAIVIGGLIKETSNNSQNKIPFLGDLWLVGKLFQSRERLKERNEIIITLLPRIARPGEFCSFAPEEDYAQATTPLLDRNLNPIDRRAWEGELPDASTRPRSWNWLRRRKTEPVAAVTTPVRVETQSIGPETSVYGNSQYLFPQQSTELPSNSGVIDQGTNQPPFGYP